MHIPISYENNSLYKTNIGAALTIISTIIIVSYILYHICILLDRSSYTIKTSETQDLTGKIDLSNTPIMFQLLDKLWNPVDYDPKVFTFTVIYIEGIFQNIDGISKRITNLKNLEIERCDKLKKKYKALNEFSEYNLTKYMCIKPNQNLILYGTANDILNNLNSLEIRLSKCNNKTNECYNLDKINDLIKNRVFAITYLGHTTNFTNINSKKNVEKKIYTNLINLTKYLKKRLLINNSKCKLNLYDNFFVTYKTGINYFLNQGIYQDFTYIEYNSNSSDELISFEIMYIGHLIEYTKDKKRNRTNIFIYTNCF